LAEEGRAEGPGGGRAEGHAGGAVRTVVVRRARTARRVDVARTPPAHRPQAPTARATRQPRVPDRRRREARQRPPDPPRQRAAPPQPDVPAPDDTGTDHREGRRAQTLARPLRAPPQHQHMTTDEKLAAILAAVQTDPGHRGLARDPHDNLFTTTAGDFKWS